jgi:hypothetical protein
MIEAEQIMKRCQAGTRNYNEANNLHAACYAMIGKLLAQLALDAKAENARELGLDYEPEPWCMKMNGCKTKCEDCPDKPPEEKNT